MDPVYEINGMGPEEGQAMSAPCIALVYSVILDSLRPHGLYAARLLCPWDSGFFWQEYWNWLPFPSPGDIPDPGIKCGSSAL